MIEYKIVNENEFDEIEQIRKKAFNIKEGNCYYLDKLKKADFIAIGLYVDNHLVGGIYISKSLNSLYLECGFIEEKYRNMGLFHNMIDYILINKEKFEIYFNTKFEFSRLEPNSKEMINYYRDIGFSGPNDYNIMSKKI